MPPVEKDLQLLQGVFDGSLDAVTAALEAGANVNGTPEQPLATIAAATMTDSVSMVAFLFEHGADPDRPVGAVELSLVAKMGATTDTVLGERPLHIAAGGDNVAIVHLLLKRCHADPNAADDKGYTPLLAAYSYSYVCVEVGQLLLEAGADPTLARGDGGCIPLHLAAVHGRVGLVDMLCSRAPASVNRYNYSGETALYAACFNGHESFVSKLLSLGAMQRMPAEEGDKCPLSVAAALGFADVVRALINEEVIGAVGGKTTIAPALFNATIYHQARVVRLLLTADGEEGRSELANAYIEGKHLLHYSAGYCCHIEVGLLLEAGADEAARDCEGRIPRDAIGLNLSRHGEPERDPGKAVAVRRMLLRGPAYRARSWAWPSDEEADDAGGSGDGDTAAAAAAADAVVLSCPPGVKTPPVVRVRIFRPREKSSSNFFVGRVGRYCAKA